MFNTLKSFFSSLYYHCDYLLRLLFGKERRWQVGLECETVVLGRGDGRWCIQPDFHDPARVAYCFGVGKDISFDLELIEQYDFMVHAFDPTPMSKEWLTKQSLPTAFHYHAYGLAGYDGLAEFSLPANHSVSFTMLSDPEKGDAVSGEVFKLSTIRQKLGHQRINLCKMDIEGAEYDVIADIIAERDYIDQLLIEFHHRMIKGVQGLEMTRNAVADLNEAGFYLFHVSRGMEFSFLRDHKHLSC